MPSEIEAGDIVWLDVPGWWFIHGQGPFRVVRIGGTSNDVVIVTEMDGSNPPGTPRSLDGLYLLREHFRKDEFRSALEQAWKMEHVGT